MLRDCAERGRTVENVLFQYNRFVKPAYVDYIKPTMKYANLIVPFGSENTKAIDFIVTNLQVNIQQYMQANPMEQIEEMVKTTKSIP